MVTEYVASRKNNSMIHEEIAYISSEAWQRLVSTFIESLRRRSPRCWQPMAGTDEIGVFLGTCWMQGLPQLVKIPSRAHGACQGCGSKPAEVEDSGVQGRRITTSSTSKRYVRVKYLHCLVAMHCLVGLCRSVEHHSSIEWLTLSPCQRHG